MYKHISGKERIARVLSSKRPVVSYAIIGVALVVAAIIMAAVVSAGSGSSGHPDLAFLATNLEERMASSISVLKLTSHLPQVRNVDSLPLVSDVQMGIPENADTDKRQVARYLLAEYDDFASIFFLTPEGNIYIGEPYEQQEQLPRLNYSDRDWYQGVESTRDAYVSSVFMSAAINVPAVAIAVPVYAPDGDEVMGYWVSIVNLDEIEVELRKFTDPTSRILLVDHNGLEVADSDRDPSIKRSELKSFTDLQSVEYALSGRSGSVVETIDGKRMTASYMPVGVHPHAWALVYATPAD